MLARNFVPVAPDLEVEGTEAVGRVGLDNKTLYVLSWVSVVMSFEDKSVLS